MFCNYSGLPSAKVHEFIDPESNRLIDADTDLHTIAKVFMETSYGRLPVMHVRAIVGQISRRDVLKHSGLGCIMKHRLNEGRMDIDSQDPQTLACLRAHDTLPDHTDLAFADSASHTIQPEMNLFSIAQLFFPSPYRRFSVLENQRLIVQLTRCDVLRAVLNMAGVLLGFLTPSKAWVGHPVFPKVLTNVLERLVRTSDESPQRHRQRALGNLVTTAREGVSPLERLEIRLHPWVAFLIIPLFALANAGVSIEGGSLGSPVAIAVATGLILGKPIGIVLFSWIGTKLGVARLPSGVNWKIMLGAGCLAGIGFTMSIFITGLALQGQLLDEGKTGVLIGSAISAILGYVLLLMFMPKRSETPVGAHQQKAGDQGIPATQLSEENVRAQCEDRWRDCGGKDDFDKV